MNEIVAACALHETGWPALRVLAWLGTAAGIARALDAGRHARRNPCLSEGCDRFPLD